MREPIPTALPRPLLITALMGVAASGCAQTGYMNLLEGEGPVGRHLVVYAGSPESWTLRPDGVLACKGAGGGWIGTRQGDYGDFDLHLEYKIPKEGNSGVFIRRPVEGDGAYTGMEIQVIDDDAKHFGRLQRWQLTGSIYHEVPPSTRATREAGTWQSMRIMAMGSRVRVYVNGVSIVDADLDQFTTTTAKKALPLKDRPRKGHIGFQNHGSGVEYRNVRVKRLGSD